MAADNERLSLTDSIDEALTAPWTFLEWTGQGDRVTRSQGLDYIEDMGRTESSVRQYYTGRYPLELLQNAHDACADARFRGVVRFAVTDSALICANEGVPFTPERIRSLVRLGSSEKARRGPERKTIGYKGVGFTAVFEISDRPQIISKTVAFGLDRKRAIKEVRRVLRSAPADVPARGFPFRLTEDAWQEDADLVSSLMQDGAVTVIRLPFRRPHDAPEVAEHLAETLVAEVLLFMPYVRAFELILPGSVQRWSRRDGQEIGAGRLAHLRSDSGDLRSWLVATRTITAPRSEIAALDDELWKGVRTLGIAAALPWWRRPYPEAGEQALHVYFPTDDSLGRAVLVHGDFYVDPGRRHIETKGPGGAVSRTVGAAAAKLAAELAASVADRGGAPLLGCFAQQALPTGFGEAMGELLEDALRRTRVVRPADGSAPRRPGQLSRLNLGSERRERQLLPLLRGSRNLVLPGDDAGAAGELLEKLGVAELSWGEIAERVDLSPPSVNYAAAWRSLGNWLRELEPGAHREVVDALAQRPIARDTKGRLSLPSDVFVRRADSPRLPPRLRKSEFDFPAGRSARELATALDIPQLTVASALEIVLEEVEGGHFGTAPAEARQVHAFMEQAWASDRREVEATKRRLGVMPVPVRKARGRDRGWRRADRTYFPSAWTGSRLLEDLYGRFGGAEFLAVAAPTNTSARRSLTAFYLALGVAMRPRVEHLTGTTFNSNWRNGLRDAAAWQRLDEVKMALSCPDGHPQTPRFISVHVLDRLDDLLATNARPVIAALGRYLGSLDDPYGRDAETWCMAGSHSGAAKRGRPIGYQRWRLESASWIPVRNDPTSAEFRPPGEAWTGTRLPRWLLVPQARLRPEVAEALGLVNLERPAVPALERALTDLSSAFPDLAVAPHDVHASAEWLLKRLDRAHQRRDFSGQSQPLPALLDGVAAWSTAPLIQDLTGLDGLSGLELLPAGQWRGLRRGYGLRRASEAIEQVIETGPRLRAPRVLPLEQQGRLAAVLVSLGADEDRVTTRLARLREVPVKEITLRYLLDGVSSGQPLHRLFHLAINRDRAGRVTGATLFLTQPVSVPMRIGVGRDLASYLDVPEHHASIGLFLTNSEAVLESENVSAGDIAEAERRVASHRRGRQQPDDEFDPLSQVSPLPDDVGADGLDEENESSVDAGAGTPVSGELPPDSAEGGGAPAPSLPSLQHDGVEASDVVVSASVAPEPEEAPATSPRGNGSGGGRSGGVDWARLERDRRLYGRRGEEVAYESERRRVASLGLSPDLVKWVSQANETAAYDIESIEDHGGPRYIEVKATTGDDPSEPFPISSSELRFAARHRASYFIYRVTNVKSESPRIHRYYDPVGELEAERGQLRVSRALLGLPPPLDE